MVEKEDREDVEELEEYDESSNYPEGESYDEENSEEDSVEEMDELESFEEEGSDEENEPEPEAVKSSSPKRINWLAIVAIVMGAAGFIYGFSAKRSISAVLKGSEQIASGKGKLSALEDQIKSIEGRLINVGAETVQIRKQIRSVRDQTQNGFDSINKEVRTNTAQINSLKDGTARRTRRAASTVSTSTYQQQSAASSVTEAPSTGYHVIQPGDTIGKLARQYGITINAIFADNPGINPRRLQIGQRIKIPKQE